MSTKDNYMDMRVQSGVELSRERLDSWKEIAVYLDREVRTVQRWEKREGLPVHRQFHLNGATVWAFKHEIDAWFKNRVRQLVTWDSCRALSLAIPRSARLRCSASR